MSSIALPALDIRPPAQQPDTTENYLRLKSLLGQQQMQQQQLQGAQQENQQRQMDIDSTKAMQKAYTEAQGDPDKTIKLAAQYGAKPGPLLQLQNSFLDQKTKTIDLVAKQGAEAKRQADLMVGAHDQLAAADPKDRAALYPQILQSLNAQGVPINGLPPQYPGDQALQTIGFAVKSHAEQVADALKQAETSKFASQGKEADVGAEQKKRVLAGTSPTGITADQQGQLDAQARGQNITMRGQNMTDARDRERNAEAANDKGTWSVQEDPSGKTVLFNNKTSEVRPAPASIAKPGTYQKQMGGAEESVQYAKDYLSGKNFTGPGDEALMEKFFDVAKPSSGFRMTQPQMDMLNHARDAYQGLVARGKHLLSPNAPYFDDTQREHIVQTMNDIMTAKKEVRGGGGGGGITVKAPNGKSYPFPDQASADAFKKEAGIP